MHKLIVTDLPALRLALRHECRSGGAGAQLPGGGHQVWRLPAQPAALGDGVGVNAGRRGGHQPNPSARSAAAPELCGFAQPQWDGRLRKRHLSGRYDVSINLRQCQRTL